MSHYTFQKWHPPRFSFHSFVRTGGPFPSAFSAPGPAGKSLVTAHNGIEVILAFVRTNQLV